MLERENSAKTNQNDFMSVIFSDAISERASDIHIEPMREKVRVRFRIDGRLIEKFTFPTYDYEQLSNRIKVLAELDLATKPVPQDGHFEVVEKENSQFHTAAKTAEKSLPQKLVSIFSGEKKSASPAPQSAGQTDGNITDSDERVIDVRVSVFPTKHGEAIVLRLLNRAEMLMSFNDFELTEEGRQTVKSLITKNYGMLLVTGPSGSGKTSMLYSMLMEIKTSEKNIITLEDPVEYDLEGIRQTNIKPDQGLTFAIGMKSILRQDPDVIMIGEIRDPETAEHAIRASLMGRAVFSTVHSNSSVGIIARLIDMGVERSIIAYALNGVISKRLVRKVCPSCKTEYAPDEGYLKHFGLRNGEHVFVRGNGCKECHNTGFKGRLGLFEIMEIDDEMRSLIMDKAPMTDLQRHLEKKAGMRMLRQDAMEKVFAGQTTLEEIVGVI